MPTSLTNRRLFACGCNFSLEQNIDIIENDTHTFLTMTKMNMTKWTSADFYDYRFKMVATKPQLEITFELEVMVPQFKTFSQKYVNVNIARRCPTSEFKIASIKPLSASVTSFF